MPNPNSACSPGYYSAAPTPLLSFSYPRAANPTDSYDKMAVREQYRTHFSLIQKSHPAIVAVSGLDHPPGGFLFPEWVAFFTGIRIR